MSKRITTLDIGNIMNGINEWLEVEPDDDAEDNLPKLASAQDHWDYDNDIIDCTEEDINEDERVVNVEGTIYQKQGHFI